MRTEVARAEVHRMVRQVPFRPFVMTLENGDRISIDHPENIAFDPGTNGSGGSEHFYVISNRLSFFGTFSAVTSMALLDRGQPTG